LYQLKENTPDSYEAIRRTVELVAPFFKDFLLRPNEKTERIRLEWFEKSSDFPFQAYHFSDGTLRFICLATLLLQPIVPDTIIIDEPELGLHPYAIAVLSSLIHTVSTRCQVIISTQSVELLNEFSPQDVVVVDKQGLESTFYRLDTEILEKWLDRYSLGDLWKKNVFGGRPTR
jgi:predicted ATPase